ncbi:hypothetical protein H4W34_000422 [Actinomadura algeriensis]|uniref:Uncharacterized protein n=1 Tax=Actinomadura algeriensis TaxID=1679523 RepID=A0ABR9JJ63_9ACTN|nr:hypothetical protein [Actinomadura algeriensis]
MTPVPMRLVQANRGFLEHAARVLDETADVRRSAGVAARARRDRRARRGRRGPV